MYNADKQVYADKYAQYLTPEAFGLKEGGRVGLKDGLNYKFMELVDEDAEEEYYKKKADELDRKYNPQNYNDIIPKEKPLDQYMLNEIMSERGMNTLSEEARDDAMKMYAERAFKKGQISEEEYKEIMGFEKDEGIYKKTGNPIIDKLMFLPKTLDKVSEKIAPMLGYDLEKKADDGRVGYKDGPSKSDIFGLGGEEGVKKIGKDIEEGLGSMASIIKDKEGNVYLPLQYLRKFGEDIFFGGQKNPELPESFYNKLGDEYIEEMKKVKERGYEKGGRVSRRFGSPEKGEDGVMSITLKSEDDGKKLTGIETLQDEDRLAVFPKDVFSANEISRLFSDKSLTTNMERKQLYKILMNPGQFPEAELGLKKLLGRPIEEFKKGGRVQYAMGSPEQNAMAASGISGIPLNVNPAGATELDMRNTGGFVPPVGVKEKADDIPAMLSNNEFVFTADAVRAAGGGSVNKGAKKMYDLMKSLEGKVV
jgi:hypothetical protein